jgi:endonuclease/exonuclease/phosphatase family metal-dependent hydrolase
MRFFVMLVAALAFVSCRSPGGQSGLASETVAPTEAPPAPPILPAGAAFTVLLAPFPAPKPADLAICSFNISFLGHWSNKANQRLADLLANCDAAVIQELIAPPTEMTITHDGQPMQMQADKEALGFFTAMSQAGLDSYVLSPAKTGAKTNHTATTASEFFVTFYKSARLEPAEDLPNGFISDPLVRNPMFDRVPFATALRRKTADGSAGTDFVLISVHLHASDPATEKKHQSQAARVAEFRRIQRWIETQKQTSGERDFIVLGDTNIEDGGEFQAWLNTVSPAIDSFLQPLQAAENLPLVAPTLWSLNASLQDGELKLQGTNLKQTKPYDHVFFDRQASSEIKPLLRMIDIADLFDIETHESAIKFTTMYSDHNPVQFELRGTPDDD